MDCSSVDVKAYALGEPASRADAVHVESCEACREELERLRLTQAALFSLEEEEVPRRIAFVSDKVFEPRWWQRIWHSAPVMGLASACILSAAIVAHGLVDRTAPPVRVDTAQMEQRIQTEVSRRLDAEVAKRVDAQVAKAVADSQARLEAATATLAAAEKRFQAQRQADVAMMQETGRYYQSKIGQMMVASNNNDAGGAQ
jgi:hypothetical protein